MAEGSVARAAAWTLLVATLLLAWPWTLAWFGRRRGRWLQAVPVASETQLRDGLARPGGPRAATLAAWCALVAAAATLPAGRGLHAADLDAGLLWLLALAVAVVPWLRRPDGGVIAGALVTVGLCLVPPVLHAASLGLADVVIAQQGGMGNWFLVRDPFQFLAAGLFLVAIAMIWPPPPPVAAGLDGWLATAVRAGLPLVLCHLLVVAYGGGWWGVAVFLDAATLPNTVIKLLLAVAAAAALRRHVAWMAPRALHWLLPLAALLCVVGSACWMVVSGAAW